MLEAKQSGNVVEDFTIGNTRIKICDDFCRTRTSGEVKEILDRVARRTVGSLTAAATPDYGGNDYDDSFAGRHGGRQFGQCGDV